MQRLHKLTRPIGLLKTTNQTTKIFNTRSVFRSAICSSEATDTISHFRQLPRFYVPTSLTSNNTQPGSLVRLSPDESRHVTKVLRLKLGDACEVCDGLGAIATAELASIDKTGALVRIAAPIEIYTPTGWQWHIAVACGSLKGGRADWLVEKCVELGASSFIPLLTARSPSIGSDTGGNADSFGSSSISSKGGGGSGKNSKKTSSSRLALNEESDPSQAGGRIGRWHRVATAAMKQCLRPHGMLITPPTDVDALCRNITSASAGVALIAVAGAPPAYQILDSLRSYGVRVVEQHKEEGKRGFGSTQSSTTSTSESNDSSSNKNAVQHGYLVIGPEGDFTIEEIKCIQSAGALPVGLGDLRLRTETAAIGLLSVAGLCT